MHVDLLHLARALLPQIAAPASASLTRLVEALLGAPLDKAQQRSDWGARPLARAQREYAAADALVLTALFDELLRRAPIRAGRRLLGTMDGGLRSLPMTAPARDGDRRRAAVGQDDGTAHV
jgi:ribonuclease D